MYRLVWLAVIVGGATILLGCGEPAADAPTNGPENPSAADAAAAPATPAPPRLPGGDNPLVPGDVRGKVEKLQDDIAENQQRALDLIEEKDEQ